jgi:hypothetical protein
MSRIFTYIHTYIPLTLYPLKDSRGISDIQTPTLAMKNTTDVTGGKPIAVLL